MHSHAPASIMQTEMIGYFIIILPRFIDKGKTSSMKAQFDSDVCTKICVSLYIYYKINYKIKKGKFCLHHHNDR